MDPGISSEADSVTGESVLHDNITKPCQLPLHELHPLEVEILTKDNMERYLKGIASEADTHKRVTVKGVGSFRRTLLAVFRLLFSLTMDSAALAIVAPDEDLQRVLAQKYTHSDSGFRASEWHGASVKHEWFQDSFRKWSQHSVEDVDEEQRCKDGAVGFSHRSGRLNMAVGLIQSVDHPKVPCPYFIENHGTRHKVGVQVAWALQFARDLSVRPKADLLGVVFLRSERGSITVLPARSVQDGRGYAMAIAKETCAGPLNMMD